MKAVSVIMPVYRKEKYLIESIRGILGQSFDDFELICIEDCSPDNCKIILEEISSCDNRIKCIYNEVNKGAAESRNIGISIAQGEYLLILDADDVFDVNLIRDTYERCKRDKLDLLIYDYQIFDNKTGECTEISMPLPIYRMIEGKNVFDSSDIGEYAFQLSVAGPQLKMYRRKYVLEKRLKFQTLSSSNDLFFGKMIVMEATRIGYLRKKLLDYRVNTEFQISKNKVCGASNFIQAASALQKEMVKRGLYEKHKKSFYTYIVSTMMMHFYQTDKDNIVEEYEKITKQMDGMFANADMKDLFLNHYLAERLKMFRQTSALQHVVMGVHNEYQYIFQYEKTKVEELMNFFQMHKYEVVIWGYGKKGKLLVETWEKAGFPLKYIVDKNYKKMKEREICSPDIIPSGRYAVLVSNAAFVKQMCEQIKGKETVIVDLSSYFTYGFSLEECLFN